MSTDLDTLRDLLLARRNELLQHQGCLPGPRRKLDSVAPHPAQTPLADPRGLRIVGSVRPSVICALTQVEQALERLRHGCYGVCLICAAPLSKARLQAQPAADCCADCAATSC